MLISRYSYKHERVITYLVDELGHRSRLFNSYLSGLGKLEGETILEGVYVQNLSRFYILDLIFWKEWFVDYPFEVRQFMLNSKLSQLDMILAPESLQSSLKEGYNELLIRQVRFQDVCQSSLLSLKSQFDSSLLIEEQVAKLVSSEKQWIMSQVQRNEATLPGIPEAGLEKRLISLIREDSNKDSFIVRGALLMWKRALHSADSELYELRDQNCCSLPDEHRVSQNGLITAILYCNNQYCFKTMDNQKVFKASKQQSEQWDLHLFKRYRVQFTSLVLDHKTCSFHLEGIKSVVRAYQRPCTTSSQILAEIEAQKERGGISVDDLAEALEEEDSDRKCEIPSEMQLENQFLS